MLAIGQTHPAPHTRRLPWRQETSCSRCSRCSRGRTPLAAPAPGRPSI